MTLPTALSAPETDQAQLPVRYILVVDDSAAHRALLSRLLRSWGFDVTEAATGQDALAVCALRLPDLVLSDWMMPGMDGLGLCRAFHSIRGEAFSYFILLSAKSDGAEVAQGLDAGADDFLTKPVNAQELRARITAAGRIIRMQRELATKNKVIGATLAELQSAYATIDRDLQHARRIQESLVPQRVQDFGRGRVSFLLHSCGHVGGDLVGAFEAGRNRIGFYGIDVSGHGIAASMVAARVAGYLSDRHPEQNLALEHRFGRFFALRPPEDVTRRLNDRLSADPGVEEYLTMLYARADLDRGEVYLVQAGHPRPLLIRASGELCFLGNGGLPIGLLASVHHDRLTIRMEPGDSLLIYSDGFIEAERASGCLLGEAGLRHLVELGLPGQKGSEFLDDLFWRLTEEAVSGDGMPDDVSAALFEYVG